MQSDWEIWLDGNISPIIAKWMSDYTGLSAKSAFMLSLQRETDLSIYYKAKSAGNVILISKDSDFPEIINRLGSPPMLIYLRLGNRTNKELWDILKPSILNAVDLLVSGEFDIVNIE